MALALSFYPQCFEKHKFMVNRINMGKTYAASRIAEGNRLFPCKITLEQEGVRVLFPHILQNHETLIPYSNIASISIDTPLIGYSTIKFNVQGVSTDVHGFTMSDAREIQKYIQKKVNQYKCTNYEK